MRSSWLIFTDPPSAARDFVTLRRLSFDGFADFTSRCGLSFEDLIANGKREGVTVGRSARSVACAKGYVFRIASDLPTNREYRLVARTKTANCNHFPSICPYDPYGPPAGE